ncbi:uncharacterized protein NPIL_667921 [Nephila pilipes]|uniref:Uncharacterized protein n=1 Tax=Nephila pilipes TaxID=299642 RepID=A0A8X6NBR5_NEPPI|nr:uncharacterized protein NPIL_667921 [Nephila pilipes]
MHHLRRILPIVFFTTIISSRVSDASLCSGFNLDANRVGENDFPETKQTRLCSETFREPGDKPKTPNSTGSTKQDSSPSDKNDRRPSSSDNHHSGPHGGHHSLNLDSDTAPLGCCSSDSSNGMFSSSEITKLSPTHPAFVSAGPTQGSAGGSAGHSAAALAAAAAAGFRLGPIGDLSVALPNNFISNHLNDLSLGLTTPGAEYHQPL